MDNDFHKDASACRYRGRPGSTTNSNCSPEHEHVYVLLKNDNLQFGVVHLWIIVRVSSSFKLLPEYFELGT